MWPNETQFPQPESRLIEITKNDNPIYYSVFIKLELAQSNCRKLPN